MSRVFSLVLLLGLTLLVPEGRIAAQDASPAAQPATPVAAAECTITPRTVGGIAEIVTDRSQATPIAAPAPYNRPDGTPADDATNAAVTETVRQLVACVNAGDFMRFLGLFSDDALRRYAGADPPLD